MPVLYGTNIADASLTTACDMATASGGSETTVNSSFTNNLNHYAEAWAQGGTNIGSYASIPTTPTGQGWVYAPGIGVFDAGNWSAQVAFNDTQGPSLIDDITLRFFKNSGSSYTFLGSTVVTSPTLQTTRTDITFDPVALSAITFAAGELVYVDIWYHNTVASGGAGNITDISPSVYIGTSATAGVASDMQITTANWVGDTVDPYIILLYGSNVADATLATARKMGTATGGTEVLNTAMTWTTTNAFGEIISAGGSIASAAAISAPTGRGWIYDPGPGPGTFALGNWSASIAMSDTTGPSTPTDITLRIYKYVGGTYTAIGSIVLLAPTINTTRTILTFAGTSMPSVTFVAGEMIYFDLWYHTTDVTTDHPAVYVSTSATVGVASDMQVTTSVFTPPAINSTWVPRVLGGTLIRSWVPRVLGGTLIRYVGIPATGIALAGECDGTSSLSGTFSLQTTLIAECDGVSTLAAPLSATLALSATTLAGIGTLAGTTSLTTALSDSLAGSGTLVGTLSTSAAVALSVTMAGSSTEVATLNMQTVLASSLGGIGQLTPTLAESAALSLAAGGVGTLTGALSGGGALAVTLAGSGILTGSLSAALALSSTTFTGAGILTPMLSATFTLPATTFTGNGTLTGGPVQLSVALQLHANGTSQLSGTLSVSTLLSSTTLIGNSTLVGTVQLSTLFSSTMPGVGILTPTIRASFTLSGATMVGVGTLSGAAVQLSTSLADSLAGSGTLTAAQPALKTALADTIVGIGQLVGALSGGGALAVTVAGTSSIVGVFSLSTALVGSVAGNGTLAGTLSARMALTGTSGGTGSVAGTLSSLVASQATLAGTSTLTGVSVRTTYLLVTLPGLSVMTGTSSRVTLLACVYMGTGSLTPTLTLGTFACLFTGISQCIGTLSFPGPSATATWVTRDLKATWKTRDLKATWVTRDLETTWKTRR